MSGRFAHQTYSQQSSVLVARFLNCLVNVATRDNCVDFLLCSDLIERNATKVYCLYKQKIIFKKDNASGCDNYR